MTALQAGNKGVALAQLKKALKYYELGFESDPRDAYPGVNYVTCLELLGEREHAMRLVPAVEYAVNAKMKRKEPDYWDYATLMELAVIEGRYTDAEDFFNEASPLANESWMFDTTKNNLNLIIAFRKERGEATEEVERIAALLG